ncbi:MAG TPA: hypothetical protein VII29_16645 [Terriglobales bacterium]
MKLRFYGQRALLLRKEIACSNVLLSKRVHPPPPHSRSANGFHRIRHCGLFASANRAETIARAREVLGMAAPVAEEKVEIDPALAQVLARLARAVAAACSSSRPSRLAARHATADRNVDRFLMGETAAVRTRITKGSPRWSTSVGSGTLLWSCLCQRPRRS